MRFPQRNDGIPEAVLLNTSGGLADGDTINSAIRWRRDTRAIVTTQAAERVYRAASDDVARVTTRLNIEDDATGCWLPQETIVFDGARLVRTLDIDMTSGSHLLALESTVFGRRAMGETFRHGSISERWRVSVDGRLIFADNFRVADGLTGTVDEYLDQTPVANAAHCLATIVLATENCTGIVDDARKLAAPESCMIGATCLGPLAVLRILAGDSQAMRLTVSRIVALLGGMLAFQLPRVWQC